MRLPISPAQNAEGGRSPTVTDRQVVLAGDAALVIITGLAAARDHVLGWVLLPVVVVVTGLFVVVPVLDRRLLRPDDGQRPSVHIQVQARAVLAVPFIHDQLAHIRLRWIPWQCRGYLCGRLTLDQQGLTVQPDWLARRDGFGPIWISTAEIASVRRRPLRGQVSDALTMTFRDGHSLTLELRQPDFAASYFASIGLSDALT